jgi:hypothetical protein
MHSRDSTRWDLERALTHEGCPICRLSQRGIARFIDGLLYESVNDPGIRHHTANSLGFCNRHAWQMRAVHGSALGMGFLNRDALNQWQSQLEHMEKPKGRGILERLRKQAAHASHAKEKCLACVRQSEMDRRYVDTLNESLPEHDFCEALRLSQGLCRQHFSQACAAAPHVEILQSLLKIQMEVNARLVEELDEFIRKNDYRFMSEGFGAEGNSWVRAIERLAGAEGAAC